MISDTDRDGGPGLPEGSVQRLAAFPEGVTGGNPAGVVIFEDPAVLTEQAMRATATRVGYSETVFVVDGPAIPGRRAYTVRYFSPEAEVPFCGHATIALGVALAEAVGPGQFVLETQSGSVPLNTFVDGQGRMTAALTSVEPEQRPVPPGELAAALDALGWTTADLNPSIPPVTAFAGAWHLILAVRDRRTLARMRYDYGCLRKLCVANTWVTVHVVWMESRGLHHVRAPFPYGGVQEDPATGAGAAAYGAYLRALGVIATPTSFEVLQGQDMGQPCRLFVEVPRSGPVTVVGTAIPVASP